MKRLTLVKTVATSFMVGGLLLSPMIANAAMTFSSISIIANALRLRTLKLETSLVR